jgi:hypothetical protein
MHKGCVIHNSYVLLDFFAFHDAQIPSPKTLFWSVACLFCMVSMVCLWPQAGARLLNHQQHSCYDGLHSVICHDESELLWFRSNWVAGAWIVYLCAFGFSPTMSAANKTWILLSKQWA